MRRVVITLAASLVLTFATALPMRALGLTAVTVSCGDDTFSATVTDGDNGGSQTSGADSFALTTFQSGNTKLHPISTTALGGGNVAAL